VSIFVVCSFKVFSVIRLDDFHVVVFGVLGRIAVQCGLLLQTEWSVGLSVWLSVTIVSICESCKSGWTDRDVVWDVNSGGPNQACGRWSAHWRHFTNTIELSTCGGVAALCQITLTTCYILEF